MIVTTTPTVEGYHITQYLGSVSGAATYLIGGVIGEGMASSRQSSLFSFALKEAMDSMKKGSSADAIVGVQHSLCGVASGNMVVSVTGTAVKLAEDPVYKYQVENAKQQMLELKARNEEAARLRLEEHRREQEQKKQEFEERKEQILNALENDQMVSFPGSTSERQKLITEIAYAMNMISPNLQRRKLQQINMESGKEIIDFLLSLPDDELKPVANNILKKLKDGA